ncbi:MAG: phenylacetate--CoA ligase [Lentisphaerae bacterium]|jgi:phenylacetate-CoA ligase|nr:phenylacetate--CoA ligase [Lentisphaerota bacterium]
MNANYWNDQNSPVMPISAPDFMPLNHLQQLQLYRLQQLVKFTYERVELFRDRCKESGVKPEHIKKLEDISLLPTFTKTDLRNTYPFGLFATPMSEIVRFHASSGTTGKPIVVAYTQNDLRLWSECIQRALAACGLSSGDIIQNAYGYGLFTGGLGLHQGATDLGLTVVPVSGGNTERQIMLMRDFGTTAISCTPSYFLHLIEAAKAQNVDLRELPLRAGIFGAEPWTDEMRRHIEMESDIEAFDIYGLTEICGPGVGIECCKHEGLHIFEDHFYPEILDPDTLEPLPDGEEGELVFTTLTKQAMPMIRYRTRDLSVILPEPCSCGRHIRRIQRIHARTDDMLIIRGINVFPSQIEASLLSVSGAMPHYAIIVSRENNLDKLEVQVEFPREKFSDKISEIEKLRGQIGDAIQRTINLAVTVTLAEPNSLPRSEGKARRVTDLRNK